jgi:TP901 family phage tail tape measure protein
MAGNSLSLAWNLIANDAASPVFEKVSAAADKAAVSTDAAAAKAGASLSTMAKVGAVAGVAFAAAAVKMATDFQRQMTLIQTQAGASAQEVRNMAPAILSLSGKVAQAPEALATSLYHVESTGLRGKAALEAVQIAAEGARVGHADLEETTNALTATIASGMLPATESYAQAMGQLNTIVGSGDMKMSDLNEALASGLLVTTKQYGVTLNDVGAALADFGDNNIRGADAATLLRMAVQAIAKPGADAASALGRVGLTVEQLQKDEQTGGLNKALTDLHTHLVNSGIDASQWGALMTDAFTKKAGTGIITLIGTFDRFEQKFKEVSKGSDNFAQQWEATTHTAAFQAAALKDNIEAMVTSVGVHLLPAVTTTMTWINSNGVPALEHLGAGALDVAHWFGELPAPIRDVALALGGLALANAIGLTGTLAAGVGKLGSAFTGAGGVVKGFGDEMTLQARLAAMDAANLTDVDRALGAVSGSAARAAGSLTAAQSEMQAGKFSGWDLALSRTATAEEEVVTSSSRATGALGALATNGGRALSGFVGALGGPAGIAIGATILLLPELVKGFDLLTGHVIDSTAATQSFTQALEATNGTIDSSIQKTVQQQLEQAGVVKSFQAAGISAKDAISGIEGNAAAQERVNQAIQDYITKQGGSKGTHQQETTAAASARDAYNQLALAFIGGEQAAKFFSDATGKAATNTAAAGQAAQGAVPGLEYAASAAGMSKDQIDAANKSWEGWIKTLAGLDEAFADPLTIYENLLSQKQAAEQKSAQATAAATKSGKDSWQDYAKNVTVSLGEYAKQLETQLTNEQNWKDNLVKIAERGGVEVATQFANMGQKGADLTAQMASATDANFSRMATDMANEAAAGGQQAAANLDQAMRVMAEIGKEGGAATAQAVAVALGVGVDQVAAIAAQYGVALASGLDPILTGLGRPAITIGANAMPRLGYIGRNADGGYIAGPGSGTSDSILSYLSNGEFVVRAAATAQHRDLLEAINNAPGFAAGGFVSPGDVPAPYSTAPYQWPISTPGDASMSAEHDAAVNFMKTSLFTGGGTGAGSPLIRALGMAIAATMGFGSQFNAIDYIFSHESGWNPLAQNPTSTAFGIPATWAAYGGKTTDPGAQIRDGISYMRDRYGSPNAAAAFWQGHHWYDQGGWLMPGMTMAYNGTGRPERVTTADGQGPGGGVQRMTSHHPRRCSCRPRRRRSRWPSRRPPRRRRRSCGTTRTARRSRSAPLTAIRCPPRAIRAASPTTSPLRVRPCRTRRSSRRRTVSDGGHGDGVPAVADPSGCAGTVGAIFRLQARFADRQHLRDTRGVFRPFGRQQRGCGHRRGPQSASGSFTIITTTASDLANLDALLSTGLPLLLNIPAGLGYTFGTCYVRSAT